MLNLISKNFDKLIKMNGLSEVTIKNHVTLYNGYVSNVNKILDLMKMEPVGTPKYNELKRRFGWEYNGAKLHELYFENISNKNLTPSKNFVDKITNCFGSYEKWLEDFKSTGLIRGVGWVLLVKDDKTQALSNIWLGEHDIGNLVNNKVILVMDVWEHAYMLDYGINRTDYINAFINIIDWEEVEARF